jgi:hypothetical protein
MRLSAGIRWSGPLKHSVRQRLVDGHSEIALVGWVCLDLDLIADKNSHALISGQVRGVAMAKFKVVLERTDTITKQAEIVVEAANEGEARQQIANDLEVDPGAYDDGLER